MPKCEVCAKRFATIYTLKRHMEAVHRKDQLDDDYDEDDERSSVNSMEDYQMDDEQSSEESDYDGEKEEDNDDEDLDFWPNLLAHIVQNLTTADYEVDELEDFLEQPLFRIIMAELRKATEFFINMEKAMNDDFIIKQTRKEYHQMSKDRNLKNNLSEKEMEEMAWNKCEYLIKKMLKDNFEELRPLTTEGKEVDEEGIEVDEEENKDNSDNSDGSRSSW